MSESVVGQQALNMSSWDPEEEVVVMNEGEDAAVRVDDTAEEQYFNFDL